MYFWKSLIINCQLYLIWITHKVSYFIKNKYTVHIVSDDKVWLNFFMIKFYLDFLLKMSVIIPK